MDQAHSLWLAQLQSDFLALKERVKFQADVIRMHLSLAKQTGAVAYWNETVKLARK